MKKSNLWRGLTGASLSLLVLTGLGYGIADQFRTQVDNAFKTSSYLINESDSKYKSDYKTGEELMAAAKALAVRQGREGTVIMKNDNDVFPLGNKVALFGNAAYMPYYGPNKANNSDAVDLVKALQNAGVTLDPTVKAIYDNALSIFTETTEEKWGMTFTTRNYPYAPNENTGDFDPAGYKINELNVAKFTDPAIGKADTNWKDTVSANGNVGVVVFMRPGGEGATYKPGIARDSNGDTLNQNPLALSPEELEIVKTAKATCTKVVVLLNTSCAIEVAPLVKEESEFKVDGLAYIGIPNDYQFTGIVDVLKGNANASGALADTYAVDTAKNPAMMNIGGGYFSDYKSIATKAGQDPRWTTDVSNSATGSFGGSSYNGGWYMIEAESIYTDYLYYETRYYDAVLGNGSASDPIGATNPADTKWTYANEVSYPFGHGLSYLPYTETLKKVTVDKSVEGNIVAEIEIKNNGTKAGQFLGQLYVHTPYTEYDKTNLVEKAAIQFLASEKVDVEAGETKTVKLTVPTKYIASYDYKNAKTWILDGGDYLFATGNGAHEAINNVLGFEGHSDKLKAYNGADVSTDNAKVFKWSNGDENNTDTTTFKQAKNGATVTNKVDNADINYYLKDEKEIKYLTRNDWKNTYPKNFNAEGNILATTDSDIRDEWIKTLRNQIYTMRTDDADPVKNYDGKDNKLTFADISNNADALKDINNDFWTELTDEISAEQAVGAVIHGGSQSDKLDKIENPVVRQFDGPTGFNDTPLSTNNGESAEKDQYFVDKDSEAGKFVPAINSQSLLGSAFSEKLAYDWGALLGNTGLWIRCYEIWGAALNYHRTQYNGRNTEYPSADPMLSNIIGRGIIQASRKYGIIVGPKHIGFNDQEHNRAGVQVYMTEQKVRETDLRGFQMAIEDAEGLGMMLAFNRLGATNVSGNRGLVVGIFRNEWGFKGLISTDMMNNANYFDAPSCIMASVTMIADFAANDASITQGNGGVDKTWAFITPNSIKKDNALVEQARENLKYQLFAFSQSALINVTTTRIIPVWEGTIITLIVVFAVLSLAGAVMIVFNGLKGE